MYFAIDCDGIEFEASTLNKLMEQLQEEGSYYGDSPAKSIENGEISVFKGTKVKIKYIPPSYVEVVEKKAVVKKPVTKKTGAKR